MLFQLFSFVRFYFKAVTRYQVHSPFVFNLTEHTLQDTRLYYAFQEIEALRQKMLASNISLEVEDFGSRGNGQTHTRRLSDIARRSASSPEQGRMLFKIAQQFEPTTVLEMGSSVGVGTMYLRSACPNARFISLEGSRQIAATAQANFEVLNIPAPEFQIGPFENTLKNALKALGRLDLVFIDGNHRPEPTREYFETCLAYAHENTVFIFDDMHGDQGMETAWAQLKAHPKVSLSVDFFELSLLFISPDFKEKQHFNIVQSGLKPWKIF